MDDDPARNPNPYQSVWQMSEVGGTGGKRTSNLRVGAGLIAGVLTFVPFVLVTTVVWGWWDEGEANWNGFGWGFLLVGLAAAISVGGYVASESK